MSVLSAPWFNVAERHRGKTGNNRYPHLRGRLFPVARRSIRGGALDPSKLEGD